MHIIVKNVSNKKKIGMVVLRLLIWGVLRQTYFMRGKNMDLKKDDIININVLFYLN